ncbi:MAG TPA: helicase-related protein, partial [Polyangiaceae bacterium]|nr:helicase-related protein [Polyangiaceae bacterium]
MGAPWDVSTGGRIVTSGDTRLVTSGDTHAVANGDKHIVAALGPTNTGKTYRALVRLREHASGLIAVPLRLLARELYDRLTADLGESQVALLTGEEKRVPRAPRYWLCTVEAMPPTLDVDFLAIDEIQLCTHRERGHVFVDRLLHARGRLETWFLGSPTMTQMVRRLVPGAEIRSHPRLSQLRAAGSYTLGSLGRRSAVVCFSVPRVYEMAERLRARRGGAAVVLGALSPRARNAQVALYESGEVDYLVATDAIGMGLNLDLDRVAFADTQKFDGRERRPLELSELSQIAGRAGRYQRDGEFGVLAPEPRLPP